MNYKAIDAGCHAFVKSRCPLLGRREGREGDHELAATPPP